MSKKRIFFIEAVLTHGVGHHLDNLIESTLFFRDNFKFDINWLLNENFEKKNLYTPEKIKIYNLFSSKKNRNHKLLFNNFIFFFKYLFIFTKQGKIFNFFNAIIKNYITIPLFFNLKVYNFFLNQNFKDNDVIIIQSCRPKEVELINFLSFFFVERPKIILRVLYPPKKSGFKNFYYFVDELKKKCFYV